MIIWAANAGNAQEAKVPVDVSVGAMLFSCENSLTTGRSEFADANGEVENLCRGIVKGVGETMVLVCASAHLGSSPPARFSMDAGATHREWMEAFVYWANLYPQLWAMPVSAGVATALSEAFPCPALN
jgi:hypothetical protein